MRFAAVRSAARSCVAVAVAVAAAVAVTAPTPAHAGRWFLDVEPLAIRRGDDHQLPSLMTVSIGRARSIGLLRPFVAAGSGFINLQARAGVLVLARGSNADGPTMLVQVRAMHSILCGEQGAFGGLGLGYRWWRGGASPFGLLATVEAGPALLRPECGPEMGIARSAVERGWLGGGSMSVTIGF